MVKVFAVMACMLFLQGCIHKIVTVPVKIAYKTTKGVVKEPQRWLVLLSQMGMMKTANIMIKIKKIS